MISFKKLRKNRGVTQSDIAEDLGVSASLIKKWESGSCTPNPNQLEQIADYFGTDINTLLGFSTEKDICFRMSFKELELEKYRQLSFEDRDFVANQFNTMVEKFFNK